MTLLLTSASRENVVRRPGDGLCSYCNKVFKDPRALGGHLRAHRGQALSRKSWNGPSRSGNSLNITRATPDPLMATQSMSAMRGSGNHQSAASFSNAARPPIFPKRSGYENWVDDGKFPEKSTGNTENQFSVSANFSPGCDGAEICHFQSWTYQLCPPPCCTNPKTVPLNHSFPSGSDAAFQFNSDPSQSFGQFSENVLPSIQCQNQGTYLEPRVGSTQLTIMRGSANVGPFFRDQNRHPGRAKSGAYNNNNRVLTHGGKRRYSGQDSPTPVMIKRPRMDCTLMIEVAEHQKNDIKELLLFKDVENPVSIVGKSFDANEEPETDLDLSLHL